MKTPLKANETRPGNSALEYILNNYQPMDDRLACLVKTLPILGNKLYGYARKELYALCLLDLDQVSQGLSRPFQPKLVSEVARFLIKAPPSKKELLILCILDLELCSYFNSVLSYCGDRQLSSLLADSTVYQATGYEKSSPSKSEIWDIGTQHARGIHKYLLAQQEFKHIPDVEAWVFGKEVAALHGNPKDLAIILGVSVFSLVVRNHAKNVCTFSLYGTLPTDVEHKAFKEKLDRMNKHLREMLSKIS